MTEAAGGPFSYVPSSAPLPNGVRLVDGDDALSRGKQRKGKSKVSDKVAWFTRKSKEGSSHGSAAKHKRKSMKRQSSFQNQHQHYASSDCCSSDDGELVTDDRWLYEEECSVDEAKCSFQSSESSYCPLLAQTGDGSPSVRARAAIFGPLVRRLSGDSTGPVSSSRLRAHSFGSHPYDLSSASPNTLPRFRHSDISAGASAAREMSSSLPFLPYAVAKESNPFSQKHACHCPACCGCRHQSTLELSAKASTLRQTGIEQRLNSWPRRKDCPLRRQLQQLKKSSPLSGSDEAKPTIESDSGLSESDLSPKRKPDIEGCEVKYRMEVSWKWKWHEHSEIIVMLPCCHAVTLFPCSLVHTSQGLV